MVIDLTQHATHSGEKLDFFISQQRAQGSPRDRTRGATRTAMAFLMDAYDEELSTTTCRCA